MSERTRAEQIFSKEPTTDRHTRPAAKKKKSEIQLRPFFFHLAGAAAAAAVPRRHSWHSKRRQRQGRDEGALDSLIVVTITNFSFCTITYHP